MSSSLNWAHMGIHMLEYFPTRNQYFPKALGDVLFIPIVLIKLLKVQNVNPVHDMLFSQRHCKSEYQIDHWLWRFQMDQTWHTDGCSRSN